ncbi:MAG TPA: hypothetical protein DHN33_08650 [Eubacteriaceae bacterium]|nr:hypothetical protein [Eubacteriaceae bacterium]
MFADQTVSKGLKLVNFFGFVIMIGCNAAANIVPLNGLNTGEVSDLYPNLFTPASFTFSIWGLIYFALALFFLYNTNAIGKFMDKGIVNEIGSLFFLSCILNSVWIVLWHYLWIGATVVVMLLLLIVLLRIYWIIQNRTFINYYDKVFVKIPFSLYLGWITVATVANITAFLVDLGWNGFGLSESFWTVAMIAVATLIVARMVYAYKDVVYGLVLLWTLTGIGYRHYITLEQAYSSVITAVLAAGALTLVVILIALIKSIKGKNKYTF